MTKILHTGVLCGVLSFATQVACAEMSRLAVIGAEIQFDGRAIKIVGLRCSNALHSDATTDDLIAALDLYRGYGVNTVSVYLMGSRFGDVKGYRPDGSLNPVYRDRLERILRATDQRGMITIVGCLYWSTSAAKEELSAWTQTDADKAVGNTARWLADKGFTHVILDPDNEGMAVRAKGWRVEELIRAAKTANPPLVVANNTRQDPPNEDLNMHHGKPEDGKPWLDSEATPGNAPGGYWGRFSKETHRTDPEFYNYSRIGRYTFEMKKNQLEQTRDELRRFNGYVLASTWLQCGHAEGVGGPFTTPGGRSDLGSDDDESAGWNQDIDTIHPDAGILWWLESVRDNYGSTATLRAFRATPDSETSAHARRAPGPVMDAETIRAGLARHDRALYVKAGWIRDPYIVLGPDDFYYLTGTTPNPNDPREAEDPYNTGLGPTSIVGYHMQLWRSRDLIEWEHLGTPFSLLDGYWAKRRPDAFKGDRTHWHLWAPEVHFFGDRWHIVHTTPGPVRRGSNLAVTARDRIEGPYSFPLGTLSAGRHDPSLFRDGDGTIYLLWRNTMIAPLSADLTGFTADPVRIDPAGSRPGPAGKPIRRIGHEGATLRRIGGVYVHFGTAWSTDRSRRGSYNLYYCTAETITGPYGPRRFAGRFLGHGTPFQDKSGNWWCTAFFNANVPPLDRDGIEVRDLGDDAQTINEQGVTIVPLEVRILEDGDVRVRAKDPAYATPGPDEAQSFDD